MQSSKESATRKSILARRRWCEARTAPDCAKLAVCLHERLPRSHGGSITDEENVIAVCSICHSWIHAHPAQSYEKGFLRRVGV